MKRTHESEIGRETILPTINSAIAESRVPQPRQENVSQSQPDLVCFSHLRWDFVFQRPQHLLTRSAKDRRVFFIEEPVFDQGSMRLEVAEREHGVRVVIPHLPEGLRSEVATAAIMKDMTRRLFQQNGIREYIF